MAAAIAAATGAAQAQQTPASPPSPPAQPPAAAQSRDTDDIVVLAPRGDEVRIDRRTYVLRNDPVAQSTNMFDVLGRIPSVNVAPSGAISLLGAQGVTIQINGQPVPGSSLEQVLRGMMGAEVERIEVMTNPSAQQSAQNANGIINIITRQRIDAGFNGSLQANVDSFGSYSTSLSPSWSRGPWSLSGGVSQFHGAQSSDFSRVREDFATGVVTTESGDRDFTVDAWNVNKLQASYRPDARRRMSVAFDANAYDTQSGQTSALVNNTGPLSSRINFFDSSGDSRAVTFDFQQNGERPREQLRFNALLSTSTNSNDATTTFEPVVGAATQWLSLYDEARDSANLKLDFDRPLNGQRFLTMGAAFDWSSVTFENGSQTLFGPAGPPNYQSVLDGRQQTLAAYTTYQFDTGDWTWLPGVRAENYRREVVSGGAETDANDLRFFPSLHVRRKLTDDLNLDISYSSRIQYPGLSSLDPSVRFFDIDRASGGNPNLRPTTTDAYEANLVYLHSGVNVNLTFYDRRSEDIVTSFSQVTPGGVTFSMPINAGSREDRGVQAILQRPLWDRWRVSASANAQSRTQDSLVTGVLTRREEFEYGGSAKLEYRDPEQNMPGADHLELELRFSGPTHSLQTDSDEYITANFTWRRRLTERLIGVLSVQDIFASQGSVSETTTSSYIERYDSPSPGARVRATLTYRFGAGPDRPSQDQAPAGPPPQ